MKSQNKKQNCYTAIGVMSGTSVDGLDLALCRFERIEGKTQYSGNDGKNDVTGDGERHKTDNGRGKHDKNDGFQWYSPSWNFEILKTKTLSYSGTSWPEKFAMAEAVPGFTLAELHRDFGRFTGEAVNDFLAEARAEACSDSFSPSADIEIGTDLRPHLIASHGHTIFHQPEKGITLQIGDGAGIAAVTGITTISDFRRLDVALGGQGAPLVPVGDELLFGQYDYCLNLGGFANISFRESRKRIAFDICPANIVLNRLAQSMGNDFDKDGEISLSGKMIPSLLEELENIEFYLKTGPRSLSSEWMNEIFMPVVDKHVGKVEDKLRTVCEHIASQISKITASHTPTDQSPQYPDKSSTRITPSPIRKTITSFAPDSNLPPIQPSLLTTGGGAKNSFLVKLISEKVAPVRVIIPEEQLIDYKEAVVFALLGILRLRNEVNCLASVTGASRDNSGGIIHII